MIWVAIWTIICVAAAIAEGIALSNRTQGDTFTDHSRPWVRKHPVLTTLFFVFWLWLGYHYFVE